MKREDIEHLATLARIELEDEEKDALVRDVGEVLEYVSQVDDIAVKEKEKAVGVRYNVMREDEPSHEPGEYTEALLDAAPKRSGQHIEVKKLLGDSQ